MSVTFTDSRLGPGKLTLGGTDYGVQVSSVKLVPDHASEDGTPTLGIPEPAPLTSTSWKLEGDAIQDWSVANGFVAYTVANNDTQVAFTWEPHDGGPTFAGTCVVLAVEFGGDVKQQNTSAFSFAVVGQVTRTEGTAITKAAGTTR